MGPILLQEYLELPRNVLDSQTILESYEKNGKLVIRGPLQAANKLNQNGRVYPRELLEREVNKYKTLIAERRSMGELDHPDSAEVSLKSVSHLITGIEWEGDTVVGQIEVLESTPMGKILKSLVDAEVKLGISSRGTGSLETRTDEAYGGQYQEVQDDLDLICWDIVSNPSTVGAFVGPITEGKVRICDGVSCSEMEVKHYTKLHEILTEILTGEYVG
jgi:hypothetical protein